MGKSPLIAVIGAGPAGSFLAYHLAQAGHDVHVYEEHDTIGVPIQCTGILTHAIADLIPEGNYIVNHMDRVRICSHDRQSVEVRFAHPNLIVCRTKFDRFIAGLAKKAGATYHLGHRFQRHHGSTLEFLADGKKKESHADILVGADGPGSTVARSAGIHGKRHYFMGVQATAELDNDGVVETYTDHGDFAWVVPESRDLVRIGLCTRSHAHRTFDRFMRMRLGDHYKPKVVARQGGLIPYYDPSVRTWSGNTYLVGDAAMMVKATTGGGILQGMLAARELAETIASGKGGREYEKRWRAKIGRDLYLHLFMRRLMDRFRPEDYNLLVRIFQRDANRRVLEEFDRDYPTQYLLRLALQEPRLALLGRVLLHSVRVEKAFAAA